MLSADKAILCLKMLHLLSKKANFPRPYLQEETPFMEGQGLIIVGTRIFSLILI